MKKDKAFISGKILCKHIFLDPGRPYSDHHYKTDKNNTPYRDVFLDFPVVFQGHKPCLPILGPKQMT
jgi:hypothetical protein